MNNDNFSSFYVIWTKPIEGTGSFKPVKKSFATLAKAERACAYMAKRYPGKKFFVMQAVKRYVKS